jgi:hypothetical protein
LPIIQPGPTGLEDLLTELFQRLDRLEKQAVLATGGTITVAAGEVIQSADFDGALPATAGTMGWGLGGSGASAVFNTAVFRNGIIGNDALTSPVFPKSVHADGNSFSLSTAQAAKATATVTVPAGFSQALVMAAGQVTARNSTTSQDALAVGVMINGVQAPGWAAQEDALSTSTLHASASCTAVGTSLLTSLGASFTVQVRASSNIAAWAADSFNTANIDAIVLFLR